MSIIGPQLLLNGTFSAGTDWTLATPWTIGSGLLTYNGTGSFPIATGTTSGVLVTGATYIFTYDLTTVTPPGFFALANMNVANGNVTLDPVAGVGKTVSFVYGKTVPAATCDVVSNSAANFSMDNVLLQLYTPDQNWPHRPVSFFR